MGRQRNGATIGGLSPFIALNNSFALLHCPLFTCQDAGGSAGRHLPQYTLSVISGQLSSPLLSYTVPSAAIWCNTQCSQASIHQNHSPACGTNSGSGSTPAGGGPFHLLTDPRTGVDWPLEQPVVLAVLSCKKGGRVSQPRIRPLPAQEWQCHASFWHTLSLPRHLCAISCNA